VMSGHGDPAAIAARLENQGSPIWVSAAGFVFVACWVGSVVEAGMARGG